MEIIKTLKFRIKDKHAKAMLAMARDVNQVWNFCNETQYRSLKRYPQQPQRQDSTDAQLADLHAVANRLGLYDAADIIKSILQRQ